MVNVCGAQSAKNEHRKNSAALSLSRFNDTVTYKHPQTSLCTVSSKPNFYTNCFHPRKVSTKACILGYSVKWWWRGYL
uniref:Uncharacterized protein n=1 Tax=Anguilla anguilla TaxID=7936 RepID=A0A0E9WWG8_ANGAN